MCRLETPGFVLLAMLGFFGAASSDADAACVVPQRFQMAFSLEGNPDRVFLFPPGANRSVTGGVVKTRWWQSGARDLHSEGTDCPPSTHLIQLDGTQQADAETLYGFMGASWGAGDCGGSGCPTGTLIFLLETLSEDGRRAYYAVGKTPQREAGEFDWSFGPDWPVVEVPRPRVIAASGDGGTILVNLVFDGPSGARGETGPYPPESILSGYQLVSYEGPADPGRDPGAWTNLGGVIPVAAWGATAFGVAVTCGSTTSDFFLATRPVFDGGQFQGDYVSVSTRILCSPLLAEPRDRAIDRSKSGRGTIRPH